MFEYYEFLFNKKINNLILSILPLKVGIIPN